MKPVFGDTSYFLALVNARDHWHAQALALSRQPPGPLLTTEWVLMELGDALATPPSRDKFSRLGCAIDDRTSRCLSAPMAIIRAPDISGQADASLIKSTARRLGEACAADQVILFGSRATGRAAGDSDVDLAMILPDGSDTRAKLHAAHRLLWPRRFPIDLVAIPASVWRRKTTLLARQIAAHGVVLYDRGPA